MRLPRFRIRTIILAIVMIALALAAGIQAVRNERLKEEVRAARLEAAAARDAALAAERRAKKFRRRGAALQGMDTRRP